jgi:hypothetical protein
MPPQHPANGPNIIVIIGFAMLAWYSYQVASRKREEIRFRFRRLILGFGAYIFAAYILLKQGLPPLEVVILSVLAGLGFGWLLVNPPKRDRRIPKAIRQQVIARDLTSKGLKWDPANYHIDHVVPYSRYGDHSLKNLRVVEKTKNLRKGRKMPGIVDFLRK